MTGETGPAHDAGHRPLGLALVEVQNEEDSNLHLVSQVGQRPQQGP